jgi:hypothetical protein
MARDLGYSLTASGHSFQHTFTQLLSTSIMPQQQSNHALFCSAILSEDKPSQPCFSSHTDELQADSPSKQPLRRMATSPPGTP